MLDSEESSSHAAEVGESSDDEWQTKETNGKPQRKRIGKLFPNRVKKGTQHNLSAA